MSAESMGSMSGPQLVERFRSSGDRRFFAELYRRERRGVYGVCLKFLRRPAAAEDACHDAFVRAFERFDSLRGDNFSAWVRRIAANLCLNRLRSTGGPSGSLPAGIASAEPTPESDLSGRRELRAALDIISSLGDEQRRAFVMFHLEGSSYAEIAECTGSDRETVRSHLQNARRNFRLRWAETPFGRRETSDE